MRSLKDIILFLLAFLLIYLVVFGSFFFLNISGTPLIYRTTSGNVWEGGGTYIKFREFDQHKKWDVLIMGSSHAYRGYDPQIFNEYGYTAYNLGTSDQNMMCTYYIAKNFVHKNNCSTVILDLYDRVFTQQNIESMSDVVQNVTSEKAALEVAMHSNDIRGFNMIAFRMFSKLRTPLNTDTTGFINGYLPSDKTLKPPVKMRKWKYETNKFQMKYLDKLLKYLTDEGIKVILTEHPLPIPYAPKDHDLFRKDILSVADKYQVNYYDFMKDSTLNFLPNFLDETHLNRKGVYAYNHKLIEVLIDKKELRKMSLSQPVKALSVIK